MSLAIDIDNVTAVLLADGWHKVARESFDMDAFEFVHEERTVHGGGECGVSATGFSFWTPDDDLVSGPVTSIVAVRYRVPATVP